MYNGKTNRKGALGERIADRYLRECGYDVYMPSDLENAHPIDRIAVCRRTLSILLCDVKTKPARKYYNDTGIDVKHWLTYWALGKTHNMRVYLIFVDEDAAQIYGQFLDVLERRIALPRNAGTIWYPRTENNGHTEIRYFPIQSMFKFANLTAEEQAELQALSTRSERYRDNNTIGGDLFDGWR